MKKVMEIHLDGKVYQSELAAGSLLSASAHTLYEEVNAVNKLNLPLIDDGGHLVLNKAQYDRCHVVFKEIP